MTDPVGISPTATDSSLEERVAGSAWYQSLRLPGGIITPGNFDTLAELEHVPLPHSFAGMRCLDIGTADGFWAFEMERRGASHVLAIDLRDPQRMDWPGAPKSVEEMRSVMGPAVAKHQGFDIAHAAYGSSVEWRQMSVYELSPENVGTFDFAFIGSLLLHLRDPVGALAAIRTVLSGELLSVDTLSPMLTMLHPMQPVARLEAPGWPFWWSLNLAAYRRLFGVAGFETLERGRPFFLKRGPSYGGGERTGRPLWRRFQQPAIDRFGILHAWVRAAPLTGRSA
jgi:tRNA (mo5U34)-methyltransferase